MPQLKNGAHAIAGLRQALCRSSQSTRTRQTTDSTFWAHGAVELDLSFCWTVLLHPTPCRSRAAKGEAWPPEVRRRMANQPQGVILEFLCPMISWDTRQRISRARTFRKTCRPANGDASSVRLSHSSPPTSTEVTTEEQVDGGSIPSPPPAHPVARLTKDSPELAGILEECFKAPSVSNDESAQDEAAEAKDVRLTPKTGTERDTAHYLSVWKDVARSNYERGGWGRFTGLLGDGLRLLRNGDAVDQAIDMILTHLGLRHGEESRTTFSIAMAFTAAHGFLTATEKLFDRRLSRHGMPLHPQTFTPLLYVYAFHGRLSDAVHHFETISSDYKLTPDISCWNALILAHWKANDAAGARKCFERLKKTDLRMNAGTFEPLLDLGARRGDVRGIIALFSMARARRVPLTLAMHRSRVRAHAGVGRTQIAERIATDLLSKGVSGSHTDLWNDILGAYARGRSLADMIRVFRYMQQHNVPPDRRTYTHFLYGLIEAGAVDQARWLFEEVFRRARVRATSFHYGLMMGMYMKAGQPRMVAHMYNRMRERGIEPSATTNAALLKTAHRINKRQDERARQGAPEADSLPVDTIVGAVVQPADPSVAYGRAAIRWPYGEEQGPDAARRRAHRELLENAYGRRRFTESLTSLRHAFNHLWQKSGGTMSTSKEAMVVPPLQLLAAMMAAIRQYGVARLADKYWKYALEAAAARSVTWQGLRTPGRGWVAPRCRHLLDPILKPYLELLARAGQLKTIRFTVAKMLWDGYALNAGNWNWYVQILLRCSQDLEAFTVCEKRLMPGWKSWDATLRRAREVTESTTESKAKPDPERCAPRAATLYMLSQVELILSRRDPRRERDPRRSIARRCPRTLLAIRTMPSKPADYDVTLEKLKQHRVEYQLQARRNPKYGFVRPDLERLLSIEKGEEQATTPPNS